MSIKAFSSFPLPATRGATCYLKSSLGRESVLLASEASSNLQYLKNGVHYVRAKRAPIPNSCQVEYTSCEQSEPPSQTLARWSTLHASEASPHPKYLLGGVHYVRAKRAPLPITCQVEYTTCERSEPSSQTLARWSTLCASKASPHPKHLPGGVRPLAKKLESLRGQIPPVSPILPKTSYNVTVTCAKLSEAKL